MRPLLFLATKILSTTFAFAAFAQAPAAPPHNVVLFVADGLRFRMVDDRTAPTMAAIAREGVSLRNSHALFPTFTTANASGMATGHMLGDTGDFSNTIYTGFEVPSAANSSTPFLENDAVLGEVDAHFSGNYLDGATILKLARELGIPVLEAGIPREMLYIADEAFFTGTAAEVTPIRSVDRITVGKGNVGPITRALQKEFFSIVQGQKADRFNWLTPVPVAAKQPVGV